jgi:hypothetical protein
VSTRKIALPTVTYIVRSQHSDGGWRLPASDSSDVYTTAWNLTALKAADWAGLRIHNLEEARKKALKYLGQLRVESPAGYRQTAGASYPEPGAAAAAVLSKMYLGMSRDDQELVNYVAALSRSGPATRGQFLLNYHNAQIMRHVAGPSWGKWNEALREHLVAAQQPDGPDAGSWLFRSVQRNARVGGRLYCTALAALTLEIYYRHPALYP